MIDDRVDATRTGAIPVQAGRNHIVFTNHHETYSGVGQRGRQWVITPSLTGWRLEFRDPGDTEATYAGTHATLGRARQEACR